jgi:glycosyltransferase involved in cell wall biosynthesis
MIHHQATVPPVAPAGAPSGPLTRPACQLSIVVPVYKAEGTIDALCERLVAAASAISPDFEILLVEDCGGDRSWELIEAASQRDARIRGIQLSRNFGQHAATLCGIGESRGRWIATLDCDLEQRPEDLQTLYAKAQEGFDLVYGIFPARSHSVWRNWTSELARYLFRVAIPSLNYEYTSFRLINGRLARALTEFNAPFPFVDGYLSWVCNRYATVVVSHDDRADGESTYTFRKLLTHTINIFVTFSDLPLKFATWIGLFAFSAGMLMTLAIILQRLLGGITVSGYASLMAGLVSFGGLQLLVLGIFGEYLSRINFKTSKKPLYLVSKNAGDHR